MSKPPQVPPELLEVFKRLSAILSSDLEQILLLPEPFQLGILMGEDCDAIGGGVGIFGRCATNPIPCNGPIGEVLYLSRLRTTANQPMMFHRLGSRPGPKSSVDEYELLSLDRTKSDRLFLSMYHPRKTRLAPTGYRLATREDSDNFTYGVNSRVANFPHKLDAHIREWHKRCLGIPLPVARVREAINGSRFSPSILDED